MTGAAGVGASSSLWTPRMFLIAVVLLLGRLVVRASLPIPAAWPRIAAYGIGSLAAFWVIERTLSAF